MLKYRDTRKNVCEIIISIRNRISKLKKYVNLLKKQFENYEHDWSIHAHIVSKKCY